MRCPRGRGLMQDRPLRPDRIGEDATFSTKLQLARKQGITNRHRHGRREARRPSDAVQAFSALAS
jgi:hypothetical protein